MKPFERLPFEKLPDRPRKPHPYFETAAREIVMRSTPFGKLTVHCREWGEGPPLLLVHGLMTSSYSFRYVIEPLGEHFRVFAPDLPGCGRSDKPDDRGYGAEALSTWLAELVSALGIEGCSAIGNSLGGYLCMRLALQDKGAFSKLVNIHSPGFPEPRIHALHAALSVPRAREALAAWVRNRPLEWAHTNVHYFDETLKSKEEAREYGAALATPEGSRAFVAYLAETLDPRSMAAFVKTLTEMRARAAAFPIPLLLVYAKQDPMVSPEIGEKLSALVPSAKMVWLDETSHFAHVDSPERLLGPVLDFLTTT